MAQHIYFNRMEKRMNKLIIALMATAFAGSVMATDVKVTTKTEMDAPAVTVKTEKPAAAPKKARKHVKKSAKKAAAKSDKAAEPAMPATPATPAMPAKAK